MQLRHGLVVEPEMVDFQHATFCAPLIAALAQTGVVDRISYFSESSQGAAVRELLSGQALETPVDYRNPDWGTGLGELRNPKAPMAILRLIALKRRMYLDALATEPDRGNRLLVSTTTDRAGLIAQRLVAAHPAARGVPFLVVVHDWVFAGVPGLGHGGRVKTAGGLLRFAAHRNLTYLTLTESGASALLEVAPSLKRRLLNVHHPWIAVGELVPAPPPPPVVFGFFGRQHAEKGYDLFERLAQDMAPEGGARFLHVGTNERAGGVPEVDIQRGAVDLAEYRRLAGEVHYAVSLLDPQHYVSRASATIVEALVMGRPVVALANKFSCDYARRGPDAVIQVETYEDLAATCRRLRDASPDDYRRRSRAARELALLFDPASASETLRTALVDM